MKYGESGTGWPFYGKHGFKQPEPISVEWRPGRFWRHNS